MSKRLNFSQNFARKMTIIAILIGMAIGLMTPATYGIMAWNDFNNFAAIHAKVIARKASKNVIEHPETWFYDVNQSLDLISEPNHYQDIKAIRFYDKNSNLISESILNENLHMTYRFRTPVKCGNDLHGFIEIERSAQFLLVRLTVLALSFTFLGIVIGIFLYRFPVNIVKLAEKDVQRQADQAKEQTEIEVARLDRLSLIGQMAAVIGHEIRNPLTTVKGYLQHLAQKPNFLPFSSQFDLMLDELSRANTIISEFLSLSHEKAVTMKACSLNHIIEIFQPLIESDALLRDMSVTFDLRAIPDILLDEKEIKQLLLNLTRNGFEAMESKGCLSIRTYTDAHFVVLSITDQGRGIDPALIKKLGTPFFTTKDSGTGLGLAVCYSIAHRHGAKIHFTTDQKGTTCSIYFPYIL